MISVILVDDEVENLDVLEAELKKNCPEFEIIGKFSDPEKALDVVENTKFEILFLDIAMPILNGFELLKKVKSIDFDIVFVTAYDNYALKAFEFCAIDYLLKPISPEKLIRVVQRYNEKHKKTVNLQNLEMLLANMRGNFGTRKNIAVPTLEGLEFIATDDILYAEADGAYAWIYLSNKEKIIVSRTLKDLEGLLKADNFARVHQSHIVNFKHVKRYIKGEGGTLVLNNGQQLQVSRANKVKLMNLVKFQD